MLISSFMRMKLKLREREQGGCTKIYMTVLKIILPAQGHLILGQNDSVWKLVQGPGFKVGSEKGSHSFLPECSTFWSLWWHHQYVSVLTNVSCSLLKAVLALCSEYRKGDSWFTLQALLLLYTVTTTPQYLSILGESGIPGPPQDLSLRVMCQEIRIFQSFPLVS